MKVIATQLGYYGIKRRREGDEFELVPVTGLVKDPKTDELTKRVITPEEQFSPKWMKKVEAGASKSKGKGKVQDHASGSATGDSDVI